MDVKKNCKPFFKIKDRTHFKQIFDEYYAPLYFYAVKIVNKEDVADDIVQDIFLNIWEKQESVLIEKIAPYLYSAVRFRCLNYLRHEKIKSDYSKLKIEEGELVQDEFITLVEKDMLREINKLIDLMPNQRRKVFLLFIEGYTQEEISKELNLSINTIKTHKLKARQFLKEQLKNSLYILCLIKFGNFF